MAESLSLASRGFLDTVTWADRLTTACTAFRSFWDLLCALETGYVPTLFGRNRRERQLRRLLVAVGLRVYPAAQPTRPTLLPCECGMPCDSSKGCCPAGWALVEV